MKKFIILIGLLVLMQTSSNAQICCGFESCFSLMGQFGISAGYGIQGYSADGFNAYIEHYNRKRTATLTKQMGEFGSAQVFWFGGKLFQYYLSESRMLINSRIFMQFTNEKEYAAAGSAKREFTVNTSTLGFGFGLNYVFSENMDFKIVELYGTMTTAGLKNELIDPANGNTKQELESPEASFGATVYTGFVYYPLPPNIGLELNLGYSFFDVPEMQFKSGGAYLQVNEDTARRMDNFISGGGFTIQAVLTVAFGVDF